MDAIFKEMNEIVGTFDSAVSKALNHSEESTTDRDFLIIRKATLAGLHIHILPDGGDDKGEIYKAYFAAGGLCPQTPLDTHYVMDGAYVVFIGNKGMLLGFLNTNY